MKNGQAGASLLTPNDGTSAAAPLWATLTAQFNVIFKDQRLPTLGFYNDLLYIASAIAPASFNDICSATTPAASIPRRDQTDPATSTSASTSSPPLRATRRQPGYDLVSGLGTPNGTLLARALAQIAHEQMSSMRSIRSSAADGSELARRRRREPADPVFVDDGRDRAPVAGLGRHHLLQRHTGPFAWTARLAQQSLQADFDPSLVTMFDRQARAR